MNYLKKLLTLIVLCSHSNSEESCSSGDGITSTFFATSISGISRLSENVLLETSVHSLFNCGANCLHTELCVAFSHRENSKGNEVNCQLSNSADQKFYKSRNKCEDWTYYKIVEENKVDCYSKLNWTLVARFSNKDAPNWIRDAAFWYDRINNYGNTLNPLYNEDMISEAFWKTPANEFKITRSDDPSHTALLETTSNCLNGKTFRAHVTSFGNFRNQTTWASNKCLGSCAVKYGGQYQTTTGFEMHNCSGEIQRSSNIGFWCHWGGDGAVMMIGGGGSECMRADQGIGLTENDPVMFGISSPVLDFGYDSISGSDYKNKDRQRNYALNLWVR